MPTILCEKCFNHPEREAVARCPECGRFYCRECVTESDFRVLCATCLAQGSIQEKRSRSWAFRRVGEWVLLILSLGLTWSIFFTLGKGLAAIPTLAIHEVVVRDSFPLGLEEPLNHREADE